jgi:hypothetical protein
LIALDALGSAEIATRQNENDGRNRDDAAEP